MSIHGRVVISARSRTAEIERYRRLLVARAALERDAMQAATADFQFASDRIARIAVVGGMLLRRYLLPVSILVASVLFKRVRPALRMARMGFDIWQLVRLLRNEGR